MGNAPCWCSVKTTDVLSSIITGKKDVNQALTSGEFPFFSCARETTLFSNEALCNSDAILISGNGSFTGFVKKYSGAFDLYQRTYALYGFKDWVDWRFVYYVFKHLFEPRYMGGTTGAAIPYITKPVITNFEFKIPQDKLLQSRIADILFAYDDLIENNRRRIALLEQAARELYREWFVRLRFPGHEHVKIVDGVPEGWYRATLKSLTTKIGSGATPRGGEASYKTSGIALFRSQNIYDYRFEPAGLAFIDEDQAKALSNVEVAADDVLLNITGASVGRCCIAPRRFLPGRVNQHVIIIRADTSLITSQFLLHAVNSPENKGLLMNIARAGGATREALTKDDISSFTILVPTPAHLESFDQQVTAMFSQQEVLSDQNGKLAQARDLLLPRLMNGSITV